MKNLKIDLTNCYGIRKISSNFNFEKYNSQIIYAQNGIMKSSFAKTFYKLSKGGEPEELVFGRKSEYSVSIDGLILTKEILQKMIYVVHSEVKYFESDKMSTLLVDENNKNRYQKEIKKIDDEKNKILTFLKGKTGIRGDDKLISAFVKDFQDIEKNFIEILEKTEILDFGFKDIDYGIISDQKVEAFLSSKGVVALLKDYINVYEELLGKSSYFKKGIFNHNNAEDVYKSLNTNRFFDAEHSVRLKGDTEDIKKYEDLEKKIIEDKNKIFTDEKLHEKFESFDKKIKANQSLKDFREFIEKNKELIPELNDLSNLKRKIWISYLYEGRDLLFSLLKVYSESKQTINEIINKANEQNKDWHAIVNVFNERFNPPFLLRIENQDDIILKDVQTPQVVFGYDEKLGEEPKIISKDVLENVLSTGERRALFILNILFELGARKNDTKEHLIILDDIADSFDYSNKYAIVEYLKELSEENNNLYFIILSHNFDFFRTVQYRFFGDKDRKQSYMINKENNGELSMLEASYFKPFDYFSGRFHKCKKIFIATIPFVRNLIEYSGGETNEYLDLTCCLHYKQKTDTINIGFVYDLFTSNLKNNNPLDTSFDKTQNIFNFIINVADEICASTIISNGINLENKIVLSIGIRLLSEYIMIFEIEKLDSLFKTKIDSEHNQTRYIFDEYRKNYTLSDEKGKLVKRAVLISPENIHLNSFMYEPILDMSENELKNIYSALKIEYNSLIIS